MKRALTFMAIVAAGILAASPAQWAAFDDHYFAARVVAEEEPLREHLIGYWPFDSDYRDYSTNSNDGSCDSCPSPTTGKVNGAYEFDRSVSNEVVLTSGVTPGTNCSVSWWSKSPFTSYAGDDGYHCILGKNVSAGYPILYSINEKLIFVQSTTSQAAFPYTFTTNWTHYVITYNSGTYRLWVNGAYSTQKTLGGSWETFTQIGKPGPDRAGWNFDGILDEVAIWDTVLTSNDIVRLYNDGNGRSLK